MQQRHTRLVVQGGLVVAALAALACSDPATTADKAIGSPDYWVGCVAGLRFTGGGRIDESGVGKVTFGFNVDGSDFCGGGAAKGQVQVVEHDMKVLIHSTSITRFSSFPDTTTGGQCGEWDGMARVKEVAAGTGWTDHHFFMQVCDNGEPGHGVDTFYLTVDGSGDGYLNNVLPTTLTGGNIQAHKS